MKYLSIILPAYNEEQCIEANIARLKENVDTLAVDYEIIVVVDGLHDATLNKLRRANWWN